jgi:hypothetical protein
MENNAIISSMRVGIMPFTIRMFFYLFRQWYNMISWQFDLLSCNKYSEILSHLVMLKVKQIPSCRLLEAGCKLVHMNGLDFEAELHSTTHMLASSSSDDLLAYLTMLTRHSFLGLSPLLVKLLDSLARLSQSIALCKTWLTSEKT